MMPAGGALSNGERPIGLRPALAEVMDRQQRVLQALEQPFPRREDLLLWKAEIVQAAVGRVSDGLRELLADSDVTTLLEPYLLEATPQAEEFRTILREALSVEFSRALFEMSIQAGETAQRSGVGLGEIQGPARSPTYRR